MYILHYAPDNSSLIIRFALEEMGLTYRTRLVDRGLRAQDSAAYRAIAPTGLIPALETPDGTLFETGAILLYLAQTHDAPLRGQGLAWLFFIANTLHADMRLHFYAERYGADLPTFRAATQARIAGHLALLDTALRDNPDLFLADGPTILTLYLLGLCRWLQLYPMGGNDWFDFTAFPAIHALARQIEARAAIVRAADAEGLGATPLSAARHATPPEGSAI